jgi:hypothetical protein
MVTPFSSAASRIVAEKLHAEIDGAGDRGARGAPQRRLHDFSRDRIGGFRTVDDPPGNDDLLVVRRRPFEVGDCHLPVWPRLQCLQKVGRNDRLRVAFALDRQLLEVHGIGDVDRKHQLDVDLRLGGLLGKLRRARCRDACNVAAHQRRRDQRDPDRDTPTH